MTNNENENKNKNDPITITHSASGASATILPFGATVTSFITSTGHECLFVSRLAKQDGSKATRGGIPLVFPQFGKSTNKDDTMPQHGFLRCNYWKMKKSSSSSSSSSSSMLFDNEKEAGCEFILNLKDVQNAKGNGIWSSEKDAGENDDDDDDDGIDCSISLLVKVSSKTLTTILTIQNNGKNIEFPYQTLFHTYFKVYGSKALSHHNMCNVRGLQGYIVDDKIVTTTTTTTTTTPPLIQDDTPIMIDREVDRIYTPPPPPPTTTLSSSSSSSTTSPGKDEGKLDLVIRTGEDGSSVGLQAMAKTSDGIMIPISAVVWNPYIEKSKTMSDFDNEEYHDMICVEPGILSNVPKLSPNQYVTFTQCITSLSN